jgi:hypothetical protein
MNRLIYLMARRYWRCGGFCVGFEHLFSDFWRVTKIAGILSPVGEGETCITRGKQDKGYTDG